MGIINTKKSKECDPGIWHTTTQWMSDIPQEKWDRIFGKKDKKGKNNDNEDKN